MPYNREKSFQNLKPAKKGEIRNPTGKNFSYVSQFSQFLDAPTEYGATPMTRFKYLLDRAYMFAVTERAEFAARYMEIFLKFAVEHKLREVELRLRALTLLDPGVKDSKYTVAEVAQRMALVEGEAPQEQEASEESEAKDGD
jgi:hypothetical protein